MVSQLLISISGTGRLYSISFVCRHFLEFPYDDNLCGERLQFAGWAVSGHALVSRGTVKLVYKYLYLKYSEAQYLVFVFT